MPLSEYQYQFSILLGTLNVRTGGKGQTEKRRTKNPITNMFQLFIIQHGLGFIHDQFSITPLLLGMGG